MWNTRQVASVGILLVVLFSVVSACPQNLGSCKCIRSAVPGAAKPVLDCSQVSDPNEFSQIEGLQGNQPGGPPVFSQIIVRRSQLQEIPPNAFGISRADEYIIENNPNLESIERGALGSNANPTLISVRNNPLLETIQYEDFNRYSNLEMLRLNDNRLLEVPDFAFDGISTKLREINLERNVILDIGSFAFRNLPALKKLNLAENQIGALESGALFFSNAPDVVDLSRNRLVSIDGDAFSDPSFPNRGAYAKHIDLSNNALSLLDRTELEKIFTQLDKLEKIANPTPPPPTTELPPPPAAVEPVAAAPAAVDPAPAVAAPAEPAAVAPVPAEAPRSAPAPAKPATENLLLQILERLQLLTGGGLPAAAAPAAVRRKRSMAVMAAVLPQTNPMEQFMPNDNAPTDIPGAAAAGNAPQATSTADAVVSAFQPFFKGKQELLEAIKTNPAAAVAAANAVQVAAEAAAASATAVETAAAGAAAAVEQAVVAAVRGLPKESDSSTRRKRQAPVEPTPAVSATDPPVIPASIYTVNFAGNPISCSCDAKWVADFRHRYQDQLQNLICTETQDSLFKLDFNHWNRLSC